MNRTFFLIFLISAFFAGTIFGLSDSNSDDKILPELPEAVLWEPTSYEDIFIAKQSYELVVIKKLQSYFIRGDIPSVLEWIKQLFQSHLVKSIGTIEVMIMKLNESSIDQALLPKIWTDIVNAAYELKVAIAYLNLDELSRKAVLRCAWSAFHYWVAVTRANFPGDHSLWWAMGPQLWIQQIQLKEELASSRFNGLSLIGRMFSSLRHSGYTEEGAIYFLTLSVWQTCGDLRESIASYINKVTAFFESGEYVKANGLPYLSNANGEVKLELAENGYNMPYNLDTSSGLKRLELHQSLTKKQALINKDSAVFTFWPEQTRVSWLIKNISDAYKFITFADGSREIGYFHGLTDGTDYESVKALWEAFAFDSYGEPRKELVNLDECSKLPMFQDFVEMAMNTDTVFYPTPFNPVASHAFNTESKETTAKPEVEATTLSDTEVVGQKDTSVDASDLLSTLRELATMNDTRVGLQKYPSSVNGSFEILTRTLSSGNVLKGCLMQLEDENAASGTVACLQFGNTYRVQ